MTVADEEDDDAVAVVVVVPGRGRTPKKSRQKILRGRATARMAPPVELSGEGEEGSRLWNWRRD